MTGSLDRPVIIIGAPRSGTNALRDALTSFSDFTTWPCDEIPFIWRYGNARLPTDELEVDHLRPEVRRYIRDAFRAISRRNGGRRVVEKTCANTLRVPFVDRAIPEALFVHIVRDGRDVAASAARRWVSEFELGYTLRKARYMPLKDAPLYVMDHLKRRWSQRNDEASRLPSWGPRFEGMDEMAADSTVLELAALQWLRCVEAADEALTKVDAARVWTVRYESLVRRPAGELADILRFVGASPPTERVEAVASGFRSGSVGKGTKVLGAGDLERTEAIIGDGLHRLGYE